MHRVRTTIGYALLTAVIVCQPAVAGGVLTADTDDPHAGRLAAQTGVEIVGVTLPEEIRPDEEYRATVEIRNPTDSTARVNVGYAFEGFELMYYEELVPAGDTVQAGFPLTARDLNSATREPLYDGTYQHAMIVGDRSVTRNVTVSGLGTPTPTRTPISDVGETTGGTVGGSTDGVSLAALDFPDQIRVDGQAPVSITVSNPTEQTQPLQMQLRFDGREIVTESLDVSPGQETLDLPIQYRMLADGGAVEPGTYSWTMLVAGSERSGTVEIVTENTEGTATAASAGTTAQQSAVDDPAQQSPEPPKRGFLTNGESRFQFLDSFSLTVGGFVLSAVGIFYQMLRGA